MPVIYNYSEIMGDILRLVRANGELTDEQLAGALALHRNYNPKMTEKCVKMLLSIGELKREGKKLKAGSEKLAV